MTVKLSIMSAARPRIRVAFAGACTLLLLAGCDTQSQTPPKAPPPPAVTVAPVTKSEINPVFEFIGQTEAVDTVELRARVEGFLVKRAFEEGDDIDKGALLFSIEKAPYEAALAAADADVAQAQATLARTQKDLDRSKTLFSRGNVSAKTRDDDLAAERAATAQVAAAEAQQRTAQLNLGYTDIYAPFAGRIGRSAYSVGNLVGPSSDVLARLVKLDPIYAVFNVSEQLYLDYQSKVAKDQGGDRRNRFRSRFRGCVWRTIRSTLMPAGSSSSTTGSIRRPAPLPCAPSSPIRTSCSCPASSSPSSLRRATPSRRC